MLLITHEYCILIDPPPDEDGMQAEVWIPRALVVSSRRRYEHEVGGPSLQDIRVLMHFIKCGADDTDRLHTRILALNTPLPKALENFNTRSLHYPITENHNNLAYSQFNLEVPHSIILYESQKLWLDCHQTLCTTYKVEFGFTSRAPASFSSVECHPHHQTS